MINRNDANTFLSWYAKVYMQNPDLEITKDTLYYGLENYKKGNGESLRDLFSVWINDFKRSKHLNVYYHPKQEGFLQFSNLKELNIEEYANCYKLYVNYSKQNVRKSVKDLFSYVDKKNMTTASKIKENNTTDSIVLRLVDPKDAIDVINYINNDPKLSNTSDLNPLIPRYGKVGLAYDRRLSYNGVLSFLLEKYYKEKRYTGSLENVSIDDFTTFLIDYYNETFLDKTKLPDLLISKEFLRNMSRLHDLKKEEVLTNFKNVVELMVNSFSLNFSINDYLNAVEKYKNKEYEKKSNFEFAEYLRNNPTAGYINLPDIFEVACNATLNKYGLEHLINAIKMGIEGDYRGFTRENGIRDKLIEYMRKESFQVFATEKLKSIQEKGRLEVSQPEIGLYNFLNEYREYLFIAKDLYSGKGVSILGEDQKAFFEKFNELRAGLPEDVVLDIIYNVEMNNLEEDNNYGSRSS